MSDNEQNFSFIFPIYRREKCTNSSSRKLRRHPLQPHPCLRHWGILGNLEHHPWGQGKAGVSGSFTLGRQQASRTQGTALLSHKKKKGHKERRSCKLTSPENEEVSWGKQAGCEGRDKLPSPQKSSLSSVAVPLFQSTTKLLLPRTSSKVSWETRRPKFLFLVASFLYFIWFPTVQQDRKKSEWPIIFHCWTQSQRS